MNCAGEHTVVVVRSTAYPEQSQGGGDPVARQADRRRRPPRGRRGLRLADDAGPRELPQTAWCGGDVHALASSARPADQPEFVAGDPGPGSCPTLRRPRPGTKGNNKPVDGSTDPRSDQSLPSISLVVGTTCDRRGEQVLLSPAELTRHAAFLGCRGAARRRPRLGLIEQLLLQGFRRSWLTARETCAPMHGREWACARARTAAWQIGPSRPPPCGGRPVHATTPRRPPALDRGGCPPASATLPSHRARAGGPVRRRGPGRDDELRRGKGTSRGWRSCLRAIDLLGQRAQERGVDRSSLVTSSPRRTPPGQRGRPARHQALRKPGPGPGDTPAQPGRPAGRPGRAARNRGPPGPWPARDAGQDAAEHHQHQVPGQQPGRPVLGRAILDGSRPLDKQVARPGRDASGCPAFDEADLYLPAVRQPATKEPMENLLRPGAVRRAGPAPGHPEPRRLRLPVPRQHPHLVRRPGQGGQLDRQDEADAQRMPRSTSPPGYPAQDDRRVPSDPRWRGHAAEDHPSAVDPKQIPEEEILSLAKAYFEALTGPAISRTPRAGGSCRSAGRGGDR